jgi:hypothetical protein
MRFLSCPGAGIPKPRSAQADPDDSPGEELQAGDSRGLYANLACCLEVQPDQLFSGLGEEQRYEALQSLAQGIATLRAGQATTVAK